MPDDIALVTALCKTRLNFGEDYVVEVTFSCVNQAAKDILAASPFDMLKEYFDDIGFTCDIKPERGRGRLTVFVKHSSIRESQLVFQMRTFVVPEMARRCGFEIEGDIAFEPVSD